MLTWDAAPLLYAGAQQLDAGDRFVPREEGRMSAESTGKGRLGLGCADITTEGVLQEVCVYDETKGRRRERDRQCWKSRLGKG